MERLTKKLHIYPQSDKDGNSKKVRFIKFTDIDEACKKLFQLETLEDELGIDLITLFQALKYGVCYITSQNQLTHDYVWLFNNHISVGVHDKLSYSLMTYSERRILLFEDYGSTWAIYRKELEECLF